LVNFQVALRGLAFNGLPGTLLRGRGRLLQALNYLADLYAAAGLDNGVVARLELRLFAGVKMVQLADLLKTDADDQRALRLLSRLWRISHVVIAMGAFTSTAHLSALSE